MLNNKVGNFKFIYVDVISEEEEAAPKKIKAHKRSGKEKPKTLQEFLERIHLQVSKPMTCLILMACGWINWGNGSVFVLLKSNWLTSRENLVFQEQFIFILYYFHCPRTSLDGPSLGLNANGTCSQLWSKLRNCSEKCNTLGSMKDPEKISK